MGPTTTVQRVAGLLATEIDGEAVLMHVDRGQYYGLAKTAKAIWDELEQPRPVAALCAALAARYSAPAGVIEADVMRFLGEMRAEGLVDWS